MSEAYRLEEDVRTTYDGITKVGESIQQYAERGDYVAAAMGLMYLQQAGMPAEVLRPAKMYLGMKMLADPKMKDLKGIDALAELLTANLERQTPKPRTIRQG